MENADRLDFISTEDKAVQLLRNFFAEIGWDYREQYLTKSIGFIDFVVKAPYQDGHIFFGVECKKQLHDGTHATELAGYMEQAYAYSKDLQMPVFIGPVVTEHTGGDLWIGGPNLRALSAMNIFGGRINIGTIVCTSRSQHTAPSWCMVLRGDYFLGYDGQFNPARINMVSTTNSKKRREPMKIWRSNRYTEE